MFKSKYDETKAAIDLSRFDCTSIFYAGGFCCCCFFVFSLSFFSIWWIRMYTVKYTTYTISIAASICLLWTAIYWLCVCCSRFSYVYIHLVAIYIRLFGKFFVAALTSQLIHAYMLDSEIACLSVFLFLSSFFSVCVYRYIGFGTAWLSNTVMEMAYGCVCMFVRFLACSFVAAAVVLVSSNASAMCVHLAYVGKGNGKGNSIQTARCSYITLTILFYASYIYIRNGV